MDDDLFRALYQAFLRYQVLLFPPQDVPPARQVSFARRFGEVQVHVMNQYHADGFPELYRLSNLDADGKPNGQPPRQGHAGVAYRWFLAARHRPGHDHLRRGDAGERRRNAFLRHVRRLRAPGRDVEGAHRRPARCAQPRFFAHPAPRRGSDDRGAAPREASGRSPGGAHASRNRAQVPVSRRPRGIHPAGCRTRKGAR